MQRKIPIEVSARHIHLCKKDLETLFGKGHEIKKFKDLNQPSDFAAEEMVILKNNDRSLEARLIGPLREKTQIEICPTDTVYLGIKIPEFKSFNKIRVPEITLAGSKGSVVLKGVFIFSQRHIHCNLDEAKELGLKNRQIVSVFVSGERSLVFHDVLVKVDENFRLAMHVDTDEGNAAGINRTGEGEIIT